MQNDWHDGHVLLQLVSLFIYFIYVFEATVFYAKILTIAVEDRHSWCDAKCCLEYA